MAITGTWRRVGTRICVDAHNSAFPLFFCITWFPSQFQVNQADIYAFTNPFMFAVHERNGCALGLKSSCVGGGHGIERVSDLCKNANKKQSWPESRSRSVIWIRCAPYGLRYLTSSSLLVALLGEGWEVWPCWRRPISGGRFEILERFSISSFFFLLCFMLAAEDTSLSFLLCHCAYCHGLVSLWNC